jgi:hypothetical protein
MANGQLIVRLAVELMKAGKVRSWSHALAVAADTARQQDTATPGADQSPQASEQGNGENRVTA